MPRVARLTLSRKGDLWIRPAGKFHCGMAEQVMALKYDVRCICKPKLDKRGFLVDQLDLHDLLEKACHDPVEASCENLAMQFAKQIWSFLQASCQVTKLVLTIAPSPYKASITVELTK